MAVAAWILMSVSVLLATVLIVAGIEMNRRSYRERKTIDEPSTVAHLPASAGEAELRRAA
jgi:hypothetical protein